MGGQAVDSEKYRPEHCRQDRLGPLLDSQKECSAVGGLGSGLRPRTLALGTGLI